QQDAIRRAEEEAIMNQQIMQIQAQYAPPQPAPGSPEEAAAMQQQAAAQQQPQQ
ncbi:MAG: cell division protein FtsZ, partial [Actinobacteria bacterium]|nr:cell division protein FtsZ [Actinomycetota bacterium]